MKEKNFEVSQALSFGWEKTKANFWLMIGAAFVLVASGMIPSMIFNKTFIWGTNVLAWLLGAVFGVGLIKIILKIEENKKASMDEFFSLTTNQFLDYLVTSLLLAVITIVGFILLIIPGIIFSLKYQFALYLILDKKMKPLEAIKKSGEITKGYLWPLFQLWLASIVIVAIGALLVGVGLLVAVPIVVLAQTYVYKKLVK